MRSKLRRLLASLGSAGALLSAVFGAAAAPVEIDYELIALSLPGQYEYRYTVTNVSSADPVAWFSIDFDPLLYDESSLTITSAGTGNWSELLLSSIQPGGDPAQLDAYEVGGTPLAVGDSLSGFSVRFTWLGGPDGPGSQSFALWDPASATIIGGGVTTLLDEPPPGTVPEPSSLALALLAAGCLSASRRRIAAA